MCCVKNKHATCILNIYIYIYMYVCIYKCTKLSFIYLQVGISFRQRRNCLTIISIIIDWRHMRRQANGTPPAIFCIWKSPKRQLRGRKMMAFLGYASSLSNTAVSKSNRNTNIMNTQGATAKHITIYVLWPLYCLYKLLQKNILLQRQQNYRV